MARLASVALAGYYPTPEHLLPHIASLLERPTGVTPWLDPCCGEGTALRVLAEHVYGVSGPVHDGPAHLYGIELEKGRAEAAEKAFRGWERSYYYESGVVHGDALRAETTGACGVLYLNPPYDLDPKYKRLEERFLRALTPALAPSGVLLFVVPAYALKASAETLSTHYRDVHVVRFPDPDYEVFKQVVLIARKREAPLPAPFQSIADAVNAAAESPLSLPVLGEGRVRAVRPPTVERAVFGVSILPISLDALDGFVPWGVTTRSGALRPALNRHPRSALSGLQRHYPAAMPLKPGHLAAALAAGVFNGECITPNTPGEGAPLLVKGVFRRVWLDKETRTNKDGEVTGVVQVEAPKLEVTVLDLRSGEVHTLKPSPESTGETEPSAMTTGDLLTGYTRTLLAGMRAHCPPDYDPADASQAFALRQTARPLYPAQVHAARALVVQLGGPNADPASRRGRYANLIGEVGSGKSSVFLVTARTIGARRVLIVCPPHLLTGWGREVEAVWPEARVAVLDDVGAVDAFAADTSAGPIVALLTRERAKLGHAWEGVPKCPSCGRVSSLPAEALAAGRARCDATVYSARRPLHAVMLGYARRLAGHAGIEVPSTLGYTRRAFGDVHTAIESVIEDALSRLAAETALDAAGDEPAEGRESIARDLARFLTVAGRSVRRPEVRLRIAAATLALEEFAATELLATVDPASAGWSEVSAGVQNFAKRLARTVDRVWHGATVPSWEGYPITRGEHEGDLVLFREGRLLGRVDDIGEALAVALGGISRRVCGEMLYQATPSPRRYPLATYITRRCPGAFDLLGIDEAHEYGGEGSAQERAVHRLTATRVPTVQLTGSLVNGYARHLFANLWGLDLDFRARFGKDAISQFAAQNGYRRRLVDEKGDEKGARGAVTDRVTGAAKDLGDAPGVQPTAVLAYVVRHSATLHKSELDTGIPELEVRLVPITPDADVLAAHKTMLGTLVARIRRDAFSELSGALWGQLAEAPSHLDRAPADVGNTPDGDWIVAYPEHRGGAEVCRVPGFDAARLTPKEKWTVESVKAEVAKGRPVIVLAWHTALFPRLNRLLRAAGLRVSVLDAKKVSSGKRQLWIEAQIAKGVDVLVTNPVAIQTGLNCLTHFATTLWFQNPGCNAIVFRQANGRIDRIGQKQAPLCLVPVYSDSMQTALHTLLMQKVAVSQSTDGLDARNALQATGVGEASALTTLSVGRMLFDLLDAEA